MTMGSGLVNADLRRKRSVDLAQRIQAEHPDPLTELRVALLVQPYPHPVPARRVREIRVRAFQGPCELTLVTATAPDDAAPAAGIGIWELSVTGSEPLPKGEAEGWARAVFGYRCAPLVYRRSDDGTGWFRRPTSVVFTVFHGEHGPMHPVDVPAAGACA
ncbi:hypothetical protein ACLFMI_23640 [Pseudonocardia nantongensis]|uniref:hypothetical protein n=1 Tax=Pseudonocardia nantongensis TaxID=1181885 RepID=UPI003979FD8C